MPRVHFVSVIDRIPCPEWPKVYKMDYGQEEAAAVQGQDPRQYLIQTKRFLKDEAGNLSGLEISDIEWVHENGKRSKRCPA